MPRFRYSGPAVSCAMAAVLALVAASCTGADSLSDSVLDGEKIIVGVKDDQPGTAYQEDYHRSGFDILLARQLAQELTDAGEPTFDDVPSQDRQEALKSGRVDLVISTYSITSERMKEVDFVGPYAVTYQGFLIREENESQIKDIDDLRGRRICSWGGTTSIQELGRLHNGPNLYTNKDASSCVEDVRSGKADALSTDQLILYGFASYHSELTVVPDLTIGAANYYGIGIAKEKREDCELIRDFLQEYVSTGEWGEHFSRSFPALVQSNPSWQSDFGPPSSDTINSMSCKDEIVP